MGIAMRAMIRRKGWTRRPKTPLSDAAPKRRLACRGRQNKRGRPSHARPLDMEIRELAPNASYGAQGRLVKVCGISASTAFAKSRCGSRKFPRLLESWFLWPGLLSRTQLPGKFIMSNTTKEIILKWDDEPDSSSSSPPRAAARPAPKLPLNEMVVLVVENNQKMQSMISVMLRSMVSHGRRLCKEIKRASNAKFALEALMKETECT